MADLMFLRKGMTFRKNCSNNLAFPYTNKPSMKRPVVGVVGCGVVWCGVVLCGWCGGVGVVWCGWCGVVGVVWLL